MPAVSSGGALRRRPASTDLVGLAGLAALLLLLVAGLSWAKWFPYWDKMEALRAVPAWPGDAIFDAAGDGPSLAGAWDFTVAYFTAVWKAVVVALLVAAAVDALVPRRWVVRALNRRSPVRQAIAGATASLPSMMCTCCTAPVTVGLRRSGVSTGAALAYWVGNPLLNPAVVVFLALVLPWEYAATRVVAGAVIAVGASALIGHLLGRRAGVAAAQLPAEPGGVPEPNDVPEPGPRLGELPGRFLRSLARFSLVLVPEYLVLVFLMGLLSPWLTGLYDGTAGAGVGAVVVAALVGTLLVIPTGGEIPVVAALLAVGAGAGIAGALLVTLPALSVPSLVMVGRSLGWRTTTAMAAAVAVGGLAAGLTLGAL